MNCIFCKIVEGSIPSTKVFENEDVLAIRDIAPQAPTHVVVLPKQHVASLAELSDPKVAAALLAAVRKVAELEKLKSFRTIANTGADAGQTVFHLHFHVMGGRSLGGLG